MYSSLTLLAISLSVLLAVPLVTRLVTSRRFYREISGLQHNHKKSDEKLPPLVPYWIPLMGDRLFMSWNPDSYLTSIISQYGWRRPLRVKTGSRYLTLIANPDHIMTVFKSSKQAGGRPLSGESLRNIFGASAQTAQYFDDDNSGIAVQPRKGSNVAPELRVHYMNATAAQEFLFGSHLQALNENFIIILERELDLTLEKALTKADSPDGWVGYPDLFAVVQSLVGRSSTSTLLGSRLLESSPELLHDFWTFDNNTFKFHARWPHWLAREAYKARERLRDALKDWFVEGQKKAGDSIYKVADGDPEYSEYLGSKWNRARQRLMTTMKLDGHDRASMDMGLMFAANSNVLRSTFWFMLHTVHDKDLQSKLLAEARKCRRPNGVFDVAALTQQPRLQSVYAEICRCYVSIGIIRLVSQGGFQIGEWTIPGGEQLSISSRLAGFNDEAWAAMGHKQGKPLSVFDAERFLVPPGPDAAPGDEPVFSLGDTGGCWMPFGGGQRKCPGRHFAKTEMLGTFAMLLSKYEIELPEKVDIGEIKPDLRWYAMGTLPPTRIVPFRIRKRMDAEG